MKHVETRLKPAQNTDHTLEVMWNWLVWAAGAGVSDKAETLMESSCALRHK